MANLICGFCKKPIYEMDLYSHAMANHQNAVEMLSAEAQDMAQKAWAMNQTKRCGLLVGGQPCGKEAKVIAGARIHTIDYATRLSNPTRGKDVIFNSYQMMCEDHFLDITPDELIRMLTGWEQIEEAARRPSLEHPQGLMLDRLFKDPRTGHVGPDPIAWPIFSPVLN